MQSGNVKIRLILADHDVVNYFYRPTEANKMAGADRPVAATTMMGEKFFELIDLSKQV